MEDSLISVKISQAKENQVVAKASEDKSRKIGGVLTNAKVNSKHHREDIIEKLREN